jgi:Zeta toxin
MKPSTNFSSELTRDQLQSIFDLKLWPTLFYSAKPSISPLCHFIGGQPACGKTGLLQSVGKKLSKVGGVIINGDDFRSFHPRYIEISESNPFQLVELTAKSSAAWIKLAIDKCVRERISFVLESTFRNTSAVMDTVSLLEARNYRQMFYIFAVHKDISWSRCFLRQERFLEETKITRLVTEQVHNDGYMGVEKTLASLLAKGDKSISIYNWKGEIACDFGMGSNSLMDSFKTLRENALSDFEIHQVQETVLSAAKLMQQRDAMIELEALLNHFKHIL